MLVLVQSHVRLARQSQVFMNVPVCWTCQGGGKPCSSQAAQVHQQAHICVTRYVTAVDGCDLSRAPAERPHCTCWGPLAPLIHCSPSLGGWRRVLVVSQVEQGAHEGAKRHTQIGGGHMQSGHGYEAPC